MSGIDLRSLLPKKITEPFVEWRSRLILLAHPELAKLVSREFVFPAEADEYHIGATLAWLSWALHRSEDGGIPQRVDLRQYAADDRISILPSYPETSGYILCSLIFGLRHGLPTLPRESIDRLCKFLLSVQLETGAVSEPGEQERGLSFDTGQALTGLVSYHKHVDPSSSEVAKAIQRAGDWMATQIEPDGSYSLSSSYRGRRSYYAQATIGLLHAAKYFDRNDWLEAAARNADWVYRQRKGKTWFSTISFEDSMYQNLHGIAYTMRGLIHLGGFLQRPEYIDAGKCCLDAISSREYLELNVPMAIPGHFANSFANYRNTISPTGMCQIAICAYMLGKILKDDSYKKYGDKLVEVTKGFQLRNFSEVGLNGLIPGSWPVTGPYMHCALPNWPIKFFLDCLYIRSGVDPWAIEG